MSKNEELIRAIKDAENAITKALNTLKTLASETDGANRSVVIGPGIVVRSDSTRTVCGVDPAAIMNPNLVNLSAKQNIWGCGCGSATQSMCRCNKK